MGVTGDTEVTGERIGNMARLARVAVFAANELAVAHVMTRTVRRCFLPGDDGLTAGGRHGDTAIC